MENAVYVGLSQQMALKRHLDIIANNLANMSTTSFKSVSPVFQEYLQNEPQAEKISYVQDYGVYHDQSEGRVTNTNRALDFAIAGDGFFTIRTEDGVRYTRNGNFKLDPEGFIVTSNGDFLLDEGNGTIQVDLTNPDIEVAADGTINLGTDEVLKLELVTFDNNQKLTQEGNGYYKANGENPFPAPEAKVLQGSLESSNVNPILEMTTMIEVLRAYESAQKLLDAEHDLQMKAVEQLPTLN
ncbi:flagellar basal-body rod protein FlgF [Sneathiella glossodoripedis]|uniref:flagellar basal-body rod protein FlgF n=1 Tax=Sneathiella glossodoripedis TaxID=418853 RepID=UPI0004711EF3|nr:flagellar basal-body rod protein FlgF [Sneathiella glossodoripedis]